MAVKTKAEKILATALQNRQRAAACPGHMFSATKKERLSFVRFICLRCGVAFASPEVTMYTKGFVAAGGRMQAVWPEYYGPEPVKNTSAHFPSPVERESEEVG